MYLDPDRRRACTKEVQRAAHKDIREFLLELHASMGQQAAFKDIRELLLELHASVDATEEIIALLGMKKENSK